jgi:small subunit ribosomal protein S17
MTQPTTKPRGVKKSAIGLVTSDKMAKTRRVEVPRLVRHSRYSKYLKRRTVCHAHDENNISRAGDTVEIMETRPISKTKSWRIVRVVSRGVAGAASDELPGAEPER